MKASASAALTLLDMQATMHRAAQPGGILQTMKWYHFPITNHDFLLAAMLVCLDLMSLIQGRRPDIPECVVPESAKFQAIQNSRAIWAEVIDDCRDARRAVSILTSVLNKLSFYKEEQERSANARVAKDNLSASATNPDVDSLRYSPYFTDQFGLGIPLIAGPPSGVDVNMETDFLDTLGSDLTVPGDFDWVCCRSPHSNTIYLTSFQRMFGIKPWLGTLNYQVRIAPPTLKHQKALWRSQKIRSGHSPTIYIATLSRRSYTSPRNRIPSGSAQTLLSMHQLPFARIQLQFLSDLLSRTQRWRCPYNPLTA